MFVFQNIIDLSSRQHDCGIETLICMHILNFLSKKQKMAFYWSSLFVFLKTMLNVDWFTNELSHDPQDYEVWPTKPNKCPQGHYVLYPEVGWAAA